MERYAFNAKAVMENYEALHGFVTARTEEIGDIKVVHNLAVAAEELIVNVIDYAYRDCEDAGQIYLECYCDVENRRFELIVKDDGVKFNPFEKEAPDLSGHISQRPIGGLGVFMTCKMTDEQNYDYVNNQNVVKVVINY